jgi:uncharacterized protein YegL
MARLEESVEFVLDPDPRCACVLLLDVSSSMSGDPIQALNNGLRVFQQDIQKDTLASRRTEIAIVTFSSAVETVQDFVVAGDFSAPVLNASGVTVMGAGIERALDLVRQRKDIYRRNVVPYYRPWIFMITDGAPTDEWRPAASRIAAEEREGGVSFFAVGVDGADMDLLRQIAIRQPLLLNGLNFGEMFLWLSDSQKRVSESKPGEQAPLQPVGWGTV